MLDPTTITLITLGALVIGREIVKFLSRAQRGGIHSNCCDSNSMVDVQSSGPPNNHIK